MSQRLIIPSGTIFGKLKIIKEVETVRTDSGGVFRKFLCECKCGNQTECSLNNLTRGHTTSCGCAKIEINRELQTKHGNRFHPLYGVWAGIKQRCLNPKSSLYSYYGGRGISVCDEWKNDFMTFLGWALTGGWKPGLEVDRINNDGNYEANNCRFVTRAINNQNRRKFKSKRGV